MKTPIAWLALSATLAPLTMVGCDTRPQVDGASSSVGSTPPRTRRPAPPPPTRAPDPDPPEPPPVTVKRVPTITGGTAHVTSRDQVVTADRDLDRIWVTHRSRSGYVTDTIELEAGSQPGQVTSEGGRIFAVLEGAGALAQVGPCSSGACRVEEMWPVCPRPVGLAAAEGRVHVACESGELVSVDIAEGRIARALVVPEFTGLRDVIAVGDTLLVSRLATADIFVVGADGSVSEPLRPAAIEDGGHRFEPRVAWRLIAGRDDDAWLIHQGHEAGAVPVRSGGYGQAAPTTCDPAVVRAVISHVVDISTRPRITTSTMLPHFVLPVDAALSPITEELMAVAAGNRYRPVRRFAREDLRGGACLVGVEQPVLDGARPAAVAFAANGEPIVQLREPPAVMIGQTTVRFGADAVESPGRALFHDATAADGHDVIACASCHPDGAADAHVWLFDGVGPRRTPDLRGGLLDRAPFHWDGEHAALGSLMSQVFVRRMGGTPPSADAVIAMGRWLDQVPAPRSSALRDESQRALFAVGEALYQSEACAGCHSGAALTNNQTVQLSASVEPRNVPSLRTLAATSLLTHDGCATNVRDRFSEGCAPDDGHGRIRALTWADRNALVFFLEHIDQRQGAR